MANLSKKYGGAQFLRVDLEQMPQLAERFRVNNLPYVIFMKKQSIEDRMDTESEERVEGTIVRLTGGRLVVGEGFRLGSEPSPQQPQQAQQGGGGMDEGTMGQLNAMGFSEGQAKAAWKATGGGQGGVEAMCQWILDHPEAGGEETGGEGSSNASGGVEEDGKHVHQALCNRCKRQIVGTRWKCQGCADFDLCDSCYPMRVMWHDEEHEFTGHKEELAVEQKAPKVLTDEEKKAEVQRLKELMETKRQMREEDAARQERELELKRRIEAKGTLDQKRKWEDQKIQLEAENLRRQKEREEQHKQQVLEKIRREKGAKTGALQPAASPTATATTTTTTTSSSSAAATSCTLQVRCPGNKVLTWEGSPDATLDQVAQWCLQQLQVAKKAVSLSTTYPRKQFTGDALSKTTCRDAQLVPRGVLVLEM